MKRIGIVIPIANMKMYENLVHKISCNMFLPEICVLINETNEPIYESPHGINTVVVEIHPRCGVNAAWEIGARLCGDVDYVSVLNDDIEIETDFFSRIIRAFSFTEQQTKGLEGYPAAICPWTYTHKAKESPREAHIIKMKRVEGWAFTIRKEILNAAFPIPNEMKTFAGDNWLWWISYREFNMWWYKDTENRIFHHVGSSMNKEIKKTMKVEKNICSQELKKRLGDKYGKIKNVPMEIFGNLGKGE